VSSTDCDVVLNRGIWAAAWIVGDVGGEAVVAAAAAEGAAVSRIGGGGGILRGVKDAADVESMSALALVFLRIDAACNCCCCCCCC